jgi:hypothetical protein
MHSIANASDKAWVYILVRIKILLLTIPNIFYFSYNFCPASHLT